MSTIMIKGILIDLDDTIYSYDECHQAGLRSSFLKLSQVNPQTTVETFLNEYHYIQKELKIKLGSTAASHHRLLYFQYILEKLNYWHPELCLELDKTYWSSFKSHMKLNNGVGEFLKLANNKNIPVVIVTDMIASVQMEKVLSLQIHSYIKYIVTSEEIGIEKPDHRIFNAALKKINCQEQDTMMIGDNFEKDIIAAHNLGIKSFWFDPTKKWYHSNIPKSTTLFSDFKELSELIK